MLSYTIMNLQENKDNKHAEVHHSSQDEGYLLSSLAYPFTLTWGYGVLADTLHIANVTLKNGDAFMAVYQRNDMPVCIDDPSYMTHKGFFTISELVPDHFESYGAVHDTYENYVPDKYRLFFSFVHSSHDSDLDCNVVGCNHTNGCGSEMSWILTVTDVTCIDNTSTHHQRGTPVAYFADCPDCIDL